MYNSIQQQQQQQPLSSSFVDKFLHDMRAERPSKKSSPVILPPPFPNSTQHVVDNNDDNDQESSPTERIIHELAQSMNSSPLSSISQAQQENDVFTTELITAEFATTSTISQPQQQAHDRKDILILFLLQHVCRQINPDPAFFSTVSKRLLESQVLTDPRFANVQYMKQVCKMYIPEAAKTLNHLLDDTSIGTVKNNNSRAQPGLVPIATPSESLSLWPFFFDSLFNTPSRYVGDFMESNKLGKGTFGSVYKCKHRIDGQEYAIKKIKIRFTSPKELEIAYSKVVREVKSLAALDHPNIVRYHQAWFEPFREEAPKLGQLTSGKPEDGEEEGDEDYEDEEGDDQDGTEEHSGSNSQQENNAPVSLLSQQLSKLNSFKEEVMFEFEPNENSNGSQIQDLVVEEEINEPVVFQKVTMESFSPDISYLDQIFQKKQVPTTTKNVTTANNNNKPKPPMANDQASEFRNVLSELFNEKNQKFEMVMHIQMQLCAPATLDTWLWSTERKQVDLETVFDLFRQIVNGIVHVHKNGLIHRDLKPSNLFLTHENQIKIGDFGLAKYIRENLAESPVPPTPSEGQKEYSTPPSIINALSKRKASPIFSSHTSGIGTYIYASPEQMAGLQYDEKVDIFSLGMILFEMLHPFATKTERAMVMTQVREYGNIPEAMMNEYPKEMQIVQACVSKSPKNRPTAPQLLEVINQIAMERGLKAKYLSPENVQQLLAEKDAQLALQMEKLRQMEILLKEKEKQLQEAKTANNSASSPRKSVFSSFFK